jgi:hypothetical protein
MPAKSAQRVCTYGGARNVLSNDEGRQYIIADREPVSRIGINPNREHDRPVVVAGTPS